MWQSLWERTKSSHLWALLVKEFRQTFRNKHLLYLLIIPPTVQLLILGGSLDPELHHLSLGICDQSQSSQSRQLTELLKGTHVFDVTAGAGTPEQLTEMIESGKISAGIVIPQNFEKDIAKNETADIQTILDGSDAYTANVARQYLKTTISKFHPDWSLQHNESLPVKPVLNVLYNPGLKASWYLVPGLMGATITLVGTLVASAVLLREKELGTLEQLLMTPAAAWEIVLAKIIPLFCLLIGDMIAGVLLSMLFFDLPVRGNIMLFLAGSSIYVFVAIGFGMLLGTMCNTHRQAQLSSFFINIPVIQLSGSVVPFESMPAFLQALSSIDPLRYFTSFARAVLLKGDGIDMLWPQLVIITCFAALILSVATMRFRQQLG